MHISQTVYEQVISTCSDRQEIITLTNFNEHNVEWLFHLDVRLGDLKEGVAFRLELTMLDEELFKSQLILLVGIELSLGLAFFDKGLVGVPDSEETIWIVEVKGYRAQRSNIDWQVILWNEVHT
jgi:hypothetical protein